MARMTAKAERAPMGEPDAEQIARAFHEAQIRRADEQAEMWHPPPWHGLAPEGRANIIAVVQDLIDAGAVVQDLIDAGHIL